VTKAWHALDITGQRFGRLVAIAPTDRRSGGKIVWRFRCDCGATAETAVNLVRSGVTRSCGCLRREVARQTFLTHGHTTGRRLSAEFRAWIALVGRCTNPHDRNFKNYGGRGIKVCNRWRHSFENFFADMGLKPSPRHSIDRIDNGGNYEPSNCRWATRSQQNRNQTGRTQLRPWLHFRNHRLDG
jgi:hypothetical protein